MLVAVGSKNPAKTKGVAKVFGDAFEGVKIRKFDVPSSVGLQPFGLENILKGAVDRAKFALGEAGRADFGVGIEAGIFEIEPKVYLNVQLAAIMDSGGRYTVGSSAGFMLPSSVAEELRRGGGELEKYAEELTGHRKVREEDGIVYHVTKRMMSRVDMTEQCVQTALAPWLNRRLYGL